jgi:hypothetical protein
MGERRGGVKLGAKGKKLTADEKTTRDTNKSDT